MRLTKRMVAEIVSFDMDARGACRWDVRRYGSITDPDSIPAYRANVPRPLPAHVMNVARPLPAYVARDGKPLPTRKTLRYNYIVPDRTKDQRRRGVTVCHVGVRLAKDNTPRVKVLSMAHIAGKGCKRILSGDIDYKMVAGWITFWTDDEMRVSASAKTDVTDYSGEWWKTAYGQVMGLAFPWHATVNPGALAETRYRWCGWRKNCGVGLLDYLHLYDGCPRIEFLAKANLFSLVSKSGIAALKRPDFMEWVRKNVGSLAGKRFTVREALYACRLNVSLRAAAKYYEFVHELSYAVKSNLHWCSQWDSAKDRLRLDYRRLRRMLPKWHVSTSEYARYLREAIAFGLDPRCEGVLYPPVRDGRKTFMERLEAYEAENQRRERLAERRRRREERKAMKEREAERVRRIKEERAWMRRALASRLEEIADFQSSVDRIREIKVAGCTCVIAKSQKELLAEGRRMGNCVGDGRYGKGTVLGDTLILMFRDKDGKSWCDAEIDRSNWRINQCYLKGNSVAPAEMHKLAATVAAQLRKVHVAHRKAHLFPALEKARVSA